MNFAMCILHYGKPDLTVRLHAQYTGPGIGPGIGAGIGPDIRSGDGAGHSYVLDSTPPKPYPNVWTRLPENLFWGGISDWAISAFREQGHTHFWFCNNDMAFVSDPPYYGRAASDAGQGDHLSQGLRPSQGLCPLAGLGAEAQASPGNINSNPF